MNNSEENKKLEENNIEPKIEERPELPKEVLAAQKLDRDSYYRSQLSNVAPQNTNNPKSDSLQLPSDTLQTPEKIESTISNPTTLPQDSTDDLIPMSVANNSTLQNSTANTKDLLINPSASDTIKPTFFQKFKNKFKPFFQKESNIIKVLLLIPAVIIGIFVIMVIGYLLNVDTAFFKITMQGSVKDGLTQQPISYAKIYINNEEKATSDNSGNYQIANLDPQVSEVKVQASGYDEYKKQTAITRGFLAYTIKQDFILTSSEKATVSGKLIANDNKYNFLNDKLLLNDKEYRIKADGSFEATDISTGSMHLQFTSMSFKDIDKTYTIKTGNNKLQDIVLEPAGDITGELKSYVSEDLVLGTQFNIENVPANQVDIKGDGNFWIKDLDVDRKYKIKVLATGYRTRDYEIEIKQGENKLFDFRLVEDFTAIFTRKFNNKNEFFISDLDGVNSEQVTFIDSFNPTAWYMNNAENKLYYLSSHEHIHSLISNVKLAYSIDTTTNQQTTLTTNQTGLGNIFSNFRAKKLINIINTGSGPGQTQKLQIRDLSGNNPVDIKTITAAEFTSTFLSDSSNFVFFYENDGAATGYYRVDVNSADSKIISQVANVQPFDATQNGEKTIFSRKNNVTGFNDLALYTFSTNETRILDENLDGKDYQFIKGSDDAILYYATRAGKDNIYKFTISQNKDEKVTNLGDDKILDIYQNDKYLFYYTNKGLYVLDITNPKNFKLVTNDVVLPS